MKKYLCRIVFLFFLTFLFLIPFGVYAEGEELCSAEKTGTGLSSEEVGLRFNIKLEPSSGSYVLSMNKCGTEDEGVTMKVTSVNGNTSHDAVGGTFACDSPYTFNSATSYDNEYGLDGITVTYVSTGPVLKAGDTCYFSEVGGELYISDAGGDSLSHTSGVTSSIALDGASSSTSIDCTNRKYTRGGVTRDITDGSFEAAFCHAKDNASVTKDFGTNGFYSGDPTTFKCDYKIENVPITPENLTGDSYFVNKKYMYGKNKQYFTKTLNYNYAPSTGNKCAGSTTISCEIECEETVDVEYGPPIAAVAGVCYEYKVRATSRVACNMTKAPETADLCKKDICIPYPQCKHSGGTIYTQAGPSESYDNCVRSCDGGKYTKSCSNKCYKQVYGTSTAYAKVTSVYHDELMAAKLAEPEWRNSVNGNDDFQCKGYHYVTYSKDKEEVHWSGIKKDAGRWYCASNWKERDSGYKSHFYTDDDGFFRKEFSTSSLCSADCTWTKCSCNKYLNEDIPCDQLPGLKEGTEDYNTYCHDGWVNVIQYDCDKNTKLYNELIQSCNAAASCSTTTAEFTISAKYGLLGSTETKTVKFPYSYEKDTVQHKNGGAHSTKDQQGTTLLENVPSKGKGLLGCYGSDSESELYRATWGFPGSYTNRKTGEVSYNPSGKNVAENGIWEYIPQKFCLPGKLRPVNVLWYNAMVGKEIEDSETITIEETTITEHQECGFDRSENSVKKKDIIIKNHLQDDDEITYNITAKTRNFGMMQWDINIKCFYGANDDPICLTYDKDKCETTIETSTITPDECIKNEDIPYRVHTVGLEDMFPDPGGSTLSDTSKTGREPGFNWSENAINQKNIDYKSNPPAYISQVQGLAGGVYSDDYLDYELYLSPTTIRNIRAQLSTLGQGNYTAFSDSGFSTKNGVARYYSEKIRDSKIFDLSQNKYPKKGSVAITCNNMINWKNDTACDTVHDK